MSAQGFEAISLHGESKGWLPIEEWDRWDDFTRVKMTRYQYRKQRELARLAGRKGGGDHLPPPCHKESDARNRRNPNES